MGKEEIKVEGDVLYKQLLREGDGGVSPGEGRFPRGLTSRCLSHGDGTFSEQVPARSACSQWRGLCPSHHPDSSRSFVM